MPQATQKPPAAQTDGVGELTDEQIAQVMVRRKIATAKRLEFDRHQIQQKIQRNRLSLREDRDNGDLTEAEEQWLEDFYPEKATEASGRPPREEDDLERTRKLKESARKEVAAAMREQASAA